MPTATRINPLSFLTDQLDELKAKGTHFNLRVLDDEQAPVCTFDGKRVINLASNNYLGFTTHPKLREAALEATRKYGVGSGAVRTIAGTMKIHMELEEKIARFKNVEACVVFQSGFTANAGTVSSFLGKDDFIISDELNHASIIDGCRLSRAKILVFRHKDVAHAEEQLASVKNQPGKKLLITDGVFSMDGDIGPLPGLCEAAEKYGAIMMVDDAHSSGVLGRQGRGTIDHFNDARAGRHSGWNFVEGDRRSRRICLRHARSDRFSLSSRASLSVFDFASAIGRGDLHRGFRRPRNRAAVDGATLGEHSLLEKRTRPARLQYRRPDDSRERNADHAHHHWRRTADHGFFPRAVQRRSARNRHRISHRPRRQSADTDHRDRHAHERRIAAGARSAGASGKEDGNSRINSRTASRSQPSTCAGSQKAHFRRGL